LPVEGAKVGELGEVAGIGSDDGDTKAACADGKQGVVGQAGTADLFVVVFGGEMSEELTGLCPVAEGGDDDATGAFKIALKALDNAAISRAYASIEFFQHHGAEP